MRLGLAEIALRIIEPTTNIELVVIEKTESGDYTSLRPNASGLILGRAASINSQGYRGVLHPHRKDPGKIRILFLAIHTYSRSERMTNTAILRLFKTG